MKFLVIAQLALITCLQSLSAAQLAAVPMQGGMVMPMFHYDAEHSHLHVMLDPTIPQLTPLLVSNPNDDFNPADPWFQALSPSRESRSFSRRYGFVMDAMSDPLPAGIQIWIRKLSGSGGLSVYRYSNTEPKSFVPIFGTEGTTNALHWNGMMFHPTFTAPAGSNSHNAVFEAYLVNADTGAELAGSSTGTFTFEFTNVPDGRPELALDSSHNLSWDAGTTNFIPESNDSLSGGAWTVITNTPVATGDRFNLPVDRSGSQKFFRMRRVNE